MSETAVVEPSAAPQSAPAATPAPAASFAGTTNPAPAAAPSAPQYIFSDSVHKEGRFNEGWTESLAEKFPSLAGKLATAKDQEGALSILNNAVQISGRRELKGAPNETWQPHEIAEYRRAFNVPEQPNEYKFKPDKLAEGVHWPEGDDVAKFLHENHVPASVAEGLGAKFHEFLQGQTQHALGEFENKITEAQKTADAWAQKEWGNEAPERIEAWQTFVETKFTKEQLASPAIKSALLIPEVIQAFEEQRQNLREGGMPGIQNNVGSGSMSPKQQAESISRDMMSKHGTNWENNPAFAAEAKRVTELFSLHAKQEKRR